MIRKNLSYQLLATFFIGAFFGNHHLYSADSTSESSSQDFIETSATQMVLTRYQFDLAATELGVESADERDALFEKCHPLLLVCDDEREQLLQKHQKLLLRGNPFPAIDMSCWGTLQIYPNEPYDNIYERLIQKQLVAARPISQDPISDQQKLLFLEPKKLAMQVCQFSILTSSLRLTSTNISLTNNMPFSNFLSNMQEYAGANSLVGTRDLLRGLSKLPAALSAAEIYMQNTTGSVISCFAWIAILKNLPEKDETDFPNFHAGVMPLGPVDFFWTLHNMKIMPF